MTHARILSACLLLSLCISACSKQDSNTYIPDKKDQLSKRIDLTSAQRPIVIHGQSIAALEGAPSIDETILQDFQNYIADRKGAKGAFLDLRKQLKLRPDQMLLFGVRSKVQKDTPFVDLSNTDLFSRANTLAIEHLALFKRSSVPEKDPYETTAAYQQRVRTEQQRTQKLTAKSNVDLGRIEDALNFSSRGLELPDSFDALSRIDYDADQALLTVQTSIPQIRAVELERYDPEAQFQLFSFQVNASAEQAKDIIRIFDARGLAPVYIAFVLDYQPNGIQINRIVLMEYLGIEQEFKLLAQLMPKQIKVQTLNTRLDVLHEQSIALQHLIPFQFGLSARTAQLKHGEI